jgi:hypothetical protein
VGNTHAKGPGKHVRSYPTCLCTFPTTPPHTARSILSVATTLFYSSVLGKKGGHKAYAPLLGTLRSTFKYIEPIVGCRRKERAGEGTCSRVSRSAGQVPNNAKNTMQSVHCALWQTYTPLGTCMHR